MNIDTRRQIIASCRSGRSRTVGRPHVWLPRTVENPALPGFVFTDAGAWEFIAEYLERGNEVYDMRLDNPVGAPAFTFTVSIGPQGDLYVKVQIGPRNNAIGRSFHISAPI